MNVKVAKLTDQRPLASKKKHSRDGGRSLEWERKILSWHTPCSPDGGLVRLRGGVAYQGGGGYAVGGDEKYAEIRRETVTEYGNYAESMQ